MLLVWVHMHNKHLVGKGKETDLKLDNTELNMSVLTEVHHVYGVLQLLDSWLPHCDTAVLSSSCQKLPVGAPGEVADTGCVSSKLSCLCEPLNEVLVTGEASLKRQGPASMESLTRPSCCGTTASQLPQE